MIFDFFGLEFRNETATQSHAKPRHGKAMNLKIEMMM